VDVADERLSHASPRAHLTPRENLIDGSLDDESLDHGQGAKIRVKTGIRRRSLGLSKTA
jgi:hypothetical protein